MIFWEYMSKLYMSNNFTLNISIVVTEREIFSNASIMIYDSNSNPQLSNCVFLIFKLFLRHIIKKE